VKEEEGEGRKRVKSLFLYELSCQYQYRLSQQEAAGVLAVVAQSCL